MVSVNEGTGKVFRRWDKHFNILSDNLIHLLIVYFSQDIVFLLKFTLTCLRCGQAAETAEQCESSIDLSLNLVSNYFIIQSWFESCEQLYGFNLGSLDQSFTWGENVLLSHKSLQQRERTDNNNDNNNNNNNIASPWWELCQCCCWIEIYSCSSLKTSFGFQCSFQMATRSLILWSTSSTRLKRMQTTLWVQQKVPQREFLNPNKCTTRIWMSQKSGWQNFEDNIGKPNFWAKMAQSGLRWPKLSSKPKLCEQLFFGTVFTWSMTIVWWT